MKIKVTTSINRLSSLSSRFMLAVLTIGAPVSALAHGKKSSSALAEAANELIATLDEMADLLELAGAARVDIWVCARTS